MTSFLLWLLQIISSLVVTESAIRKYPEGSNFLDKLSKLGLFILHSRVNPDYKKELRYLRNIFGTVATFFLVLHFVSELENRSIYSIGLLLFGFFWLSLHHAINLKKDFIESLSLCVILTIFPWIILGLDIVNGNQSNLFFFISNPLSAFGIHDWEPYRIAGFLSIVLGLFGVFFIIFRTLFLSIIPILVLFLLVCVAKASRIALQVEPKVAYYIAILYFIAVTPILVS